MKFGNLDIDSNNAHQYSQLIIERLTTYFDEFAISRKIHVYVVDWAIGICKQSNDFNQLLALMYVISEYAKKVDSTRLKQICQELIPTNGLDAELIIDYEQFIKESFKQCLNLNPDLNRETAKIVDIFTQFNEELDDIISQHTGMIIPLPPKAAEEMAEREQYISDQALQLFNKIIADIDDVPAEARSTELMARAYQINDKEIFASVKSKIEEKLRIDYLRELSSFITSDPADYQFIERHIKINDKFNQILKSLSPAEADKFISRLCVWPDVLVWAETIKLSDSNLVRLAQAMSATQFADEVENSFNDRLIAYLKNYDGKQVIPHGSHLEKLIVKVLIDVEQTSAIDPAVVDRLFECLSQENKKRLIQRYQHVLNDYTKLEDILHLFAMHRIIDPEKTFSGLINKTDPKINQLLAHSHLLSHDAKWGHKSSIDSRTEFERIRKLKKSAAEIYRALLIQVVKNKQHLPLSVYQDDEFKTDRLFDSTSPQTESLENVKWIFPKVSPIPRMIKHVDELDLTIAEGTRKELYDWFYSLKQSNVLLHLKNYAVSAGAFYLTQVISQFESYDHLSAAEKEKVNLADGNIADALLNSVKLLRRYMAATEVDYNFSLMSALQFDTVDETTIVFHLQRFTQIIKSYINSTMPKTTTLATCLQHIWRSIEGHIGNPNVSYAFHRFITTLLRIRENDRDDLLHAMSLRTLGLLFDMSTRGVMGSEHYQQAVPHVTQQAVTSKEKPGVPEDKLTSAMALLSALSIQEEVISPPSDRDHRFILNSITDYFKAHPLETEKLNLIKNSIDIVSFDFLTTKYKSLFKLIFNKKISSHTLDEHLKNGVWIQHILRHPVALALMDKQDIAALVQQYSAISRILKLDQMPQYSQELRRLRTHIQAKKVERSALHAEIQRRNATPTDKQKLRLVEKDRVTVNEIVTRTLSNEDCEYLAKTHSTGYLIVMVKAYIEKPDIETAKRLLISLLQSDNLSLSVQRSSELLDLGKKVGLTIERAAQLQVEIESEDAKALLLDYQITLLEKRYEFVSRQHNRVLKFKVEHSVRELHRQFETGVEQLQKTLAIISMLLKNYEAQILTFHFETDSGRMINLTQQDASNLNALLINISYPPLVAAIKSLLIEMEHVEKGAANNIDNALNLVSGLVAELQQQTEHSQRIYGEYVASQLTQNSISGFLQSFTHRLYEAGTKGKGDIEQDQSWLSWLANQLPHKTFMQMELERKTVTTELLRQETEIPLYVFDGAREEYVFIGNIAKADDDGITLDRQVAMFAIGESVYDANENLIGFINHNGHIQNETAFQKHTSFYLLTYSELSQLQKLQHQTPLVHDVLQQGQLTEFYQYILSEKLADNEQYIQKNQDKLDAGKIKTYLYSKREFLKKLFVQTLCEEEYSHQLSEKDCEMVAAEHSTTDLIAIINAYLNKNDIATAKRLLVLHLQSQNLLIDIRTAIELFKLFKRVSLSVEDSAALQHQRISEDAKQLLFAYQLTSTDYLDQLSGTRIYDTINPAITREIRPLANESFHAVVNQLQFEMFPIDIIQQLPPQVRCEILLSPANFPRLLALSRENNQWGRGLLLESPGDYDPKIIIDYFLRNCLGRIYFKDGFKYFYLADRELVISALRRLDATAMQNILNTILIDPDLAKFIREDSKALDAIAKSDLSIRGIIDTDFILSHIRHIYHGFYYSDDALEILKRLSRDRFDDLIKSKLSTDDIRVLSLFANADQRKELAAKMRIDINGETKFYGSDQRLNKDYVETFLITYLEKKNPETETDFNKIKALLNDVKTQLSNTNIFDELHRFCLSTSNTQLAQVITSIIDVPGNLDDIIRHASHYPLVFVTASPTAYARIQPEDCVRIIPSELINILKTKDNHYAINFCTLLHKQTTAAKKQLAGPLTTPENKEKLSCLNSILAITAQARNEAKTEASIKKSFWARWIYNSVDGFHLFDTKSSLDKNRQYFKFNHHVDSSARDKHTFAKLTQELKGKPAETHFDKRYEAIASYFETDRPDEDSLSLYIKTLHATKFTSSTNTDVLHYRIEFAKLFSNLYHLAYLTPKNAAKIQIKIAGKLLTVDVKEKSAHLDHLKKVMPDIIPIIVENCTKMVEGYLNHLHQYPKDEMSKKELSEQLGFIIIESERFTKMGAEPYADQLRMLLRDCESMMEWHSVQAAAIKSIEQAEHIGTEPGIGSVSRILL